MKCFYLKIFLIVTVFLSGYFCPALAQTQNNGTDESSNNESSPGLFTPFSDQQSVSDPLNNGESLFSGPPPGTGGNPIGGETPIGHGLQVLMWLSFGYVFYVVAFNSKKKNEK